MKKFAALVNKINFFYKIALEFTPVNTTQITPSQPTSNVGSSMNDINIIKQTIQALIAMYYPQTQQHP